MLYHASTKWEEAQKLEEEAQWLEREGWGKFREAMVGSEAEGFYGLLRGVTSCSHLLLSQPLLQRSCLVPSSSISQLPPQESTGLEASDPAGQATVSSPPAATPAPEGDIPAHMQPLWIQLGGTKQVYQCQVEGLQRGAINLMGHHQCPCAKGTLGGEVGVSSLQQNFFQSRCPQGATERLMIKL